jgi:hypothetical protein
MLEFAFFLLVLLGFLAGAGFLYVLLNRLTRRVGTGEDLNLSLLRDEVDALTARLGRMEEEMEFYRQLKAPEESGPGRALEGPEGEGS